MAILECVPNFSEGRNQKTLEAIADAINKVRGVSLLDMDTGYHANRTVYTFTGNPEAVTEAAFKAIQTAIQNIDMRNHQGEHPRIGATDVCPLIPVSGMDISEVILLSKRLGKRVGEELGIPVFLYEESASASYRKNLSWLRSGEYEGLSDKILRSDFQPDYGPSIFNPKSGIAIIGARDFLIAYNVNLNTKDISVAREIAAEIRSSSATGLPHLKAIGWYIKEFDKVQVSMNLTRYSVTGLAEAFESVKMAAFNKGIEVTGSELVGMAPLEAFLQAADKKGIVSDNQPEQINKIAEYLGLNDVKPFNPFQKILEWRMNL